ncbi:MAG TPA: serine hydrolase domain-containing protein [Pyrinomonadaceae bacterium]|nr:serine hydrolase domain-containing protein [Pyrinomonadaceae bacterium]
MTSKKVYSRKRNALPKLAKIDEIVTNYLDRLCDGAFKKGERVPGVAVAVRWNKKIVHLNCYGYANLETGAKIKPNTVFDLGSLSKQFTAAAVYNLIIHGQLDLNEPLSNFFFELPRWADAITVEDLLHHTSSLPSYFDIYEQLKPRAKGFYNKALEKPDHWYPTMPNRKKKELSNKNVLEWLATRKRVRAPDTEYVYSNSGYVVLAELVERVAEQPFARYVMETVVFGIDAEMRNTYVFDEEYGFAPDDPQTANHAKCYNRVKGRFVPVGYTPLNFIVGDGNVHSTIRDLAMWEKFLHTLDYHLPARALLWSPVLIKNRKQVNYGAGWRLIRDKYEGPVKVKGKLVNRKYEFRSEYHRGEWLAWRSFIGRASKWVVPEGGKRIEAKRAESLGIIVLSNADFGDKQFTPCRIAQEISKLYLGKSKKDNIMNRFNCDL